MITTKISINLNKISNINKFTELVNWISNPIDVSQGRYNIDAKSALGLYLLDWEKPITLTIYGEITSDNLFILENFSEERDE